MEGWAHLTAQVNAIAEDMDANYILTSHYRLASELSAYSRAPIPIVQFNESIRWVSFPKARITPTRAASTSSKTIGILPAFPLTFLLNHGRLLRSIAAAANSQSKNTSYISSLTPITRHSKS